MNGTRRLQVMAAATAVAAIGVLSPAVVRAATIVPVGNDAAGAAALAQAVLGTPSAFASAGFDEIPVGSAPHAVSDALSYFPTDGDDFAILTTGDPTLADDPNTAPNSGAALGGGPVRGNTDMDVSIFNVALEVPPTANCLSFEFAFYSEEFPEYVNHSVNDAFVAELDESTWTTSGNTIIAPDNFAFDPSGDVISVDSTGATSMNAANAAGTTYDGATVLLSAATPVTPGPHNLYLSIFDQGDQIFDSAVFVDNLVVGFVPDPAVNCAPGAQPANFQLQLTPETGLSPTGTPHTVTAVLNDGDGPVAGAEVDFAVSGANASSGSVITDPTGTATFSYTGTAAGDDVIVASYDVDGDGTFEASDSATMTWFTPTLLSIDDVSVVEGDDGTAAAVFTVTASPPPAAPVTFTVQTADGSANAPADYDTLPATAVSLAADQASTTVSVPVNGDRIDEPDETFVVNLSDAVGAGIDDGQGVATILDDDRDGAFTCRATALRLGTNETAVANAANDPCRDANSSVVSRSIGLPFLASIGADALFGSTDQTPDDLDATDPADGDHGFANGGLDQVTITVGPATIVAETLSSSATVECQDGSPVLSSAGTIQSLRVNGVEVDVTGTTSIDVGVLVIGINEVTTGPTSITRRALTVSSPLLPPVVVAEATAGYVGNPCQQ